MSILSPPREIPCRIQIGINTILTPHYHSLIEGPRYTVIAGNFKICNYTFQLEGIINFAIGVSPFPVDLLCISIVCEIDSLNNHTRTNKQCNDPSPNTIAKQSFHNYLKLLSFSNSSFDHIML